MKKYRIAAALCAAFLLTISFSTVAYAGGGEEATEETTVTESVIDETNPLTPDGTGTVVDNVTSEDAKQFYTITTPAGNIFYLIIDLERDSDNVYFLDAVTEKDLLALAEQSGDTVENVSAIPDNTTPTVTESDPEAEAPTEQETSKTSGGNGGIIIVVLIALAAGGAGYYFKIYRPKQQANTGADYEAGEEYEEYEDTYGEDAEDDTPPWDEDEDYSGDGEA